MRKKREKVFLYDPPFRHPSFLCHRSCGLAEVVFFRISRPRFWSSFLKKPVLHVNFEALAGCSKEKGNSFWLTSSKVPYSGWSFLWIQIQIGHWLPFRSPPPVAPPNSRRHMCRKRKLGYEWRGEEGGEGSHSRMAIEWPWVEEGACVTASCSEDGEQSDTRYRGGMHWATVRHTDSPASDSHNAALTQLGCGAQPACLMSKCIQLSLFVSEL